MIEPKIPGIRHGMGYIAGAYYKGSFVKMDGEFSSSDITALPTGQKNKPGYASAGDLKLTQVTSAATGQRGLVFPINKLNYKPEDSDTSLDLIDAGASVIYYQGGQYETDQFLAVSGTAGGDFGDNLEITVSGKLTESAQDDTSTQVVAKVIKMTYSDMGYNDDFFGEESVVMNDRWSRDSLWYQLL